MRRHPLKVNRGRMEVRLQKVIPGAEGRLTVQQFLRGVKPRVVPVGRLDYDTEGLLLLTNDGELAQRLLHPRYHVPKTYLVKVSGVLDDAQIRMLEAGVRLEDGLH